MPNHAILTSEAHRELRVVPTRGAAHGDAVMSCLVVPDEFRRVQNEYPILFQVSLERDRYNALALFGFETGENLFLDGDRWDARYRPLAMDIQPFLIGRPATPDGQAQVHVDLDSPRVATGAEGVRVFDEDGRPTPYLETVADQLGALDAGWRGSDDFFAALSRYELIEPLAIDVLLDDGSEHRLAGYHGIDEDRLRALDPSELGDLHQAGHLMPIFMALASLSNLGRLIARKNERLAHG